MLTRSCCLQYEEMPWIEDAHEVMPLSPTSPPEDVRPTDGVAPISIDSAPAEPLPPSQTISLVSLASRPIESETQRSPGLSREPCAATVPDKAEITGRQEEATTGGPESSKEPAEEASESNPVETVDIAAKLAEQLMRFHGCDTHAQNEQDHNSGAGHTTLDGFISHHDAIPDTLSAPHMLAKGQVHPSDAEEWRHAFLGTTAEEVETPMTVCMQCSCAERPSDAAPAITYDVDSIMGFARTLAVAKQGIRFNVTPHVISNLDSDIHLTLLTPTSNGQTRRVALHTVPHYQFGRVVGYEDVTLYLFFPHLYERRKANNYLNQDTLRRWTDRVLLPAIYSQASASILQHYPAGYEHSKLSSKASHTEAHTRKDKSGVRHQYIHHFLQHSILQEVWDIILRPMINSTQLRKSTQHGYYALSG
jgi:hypothetical protein